ncbi:MAG: hypothetical protein CM15mP122_5610 [Bacteroidota bacterium]|nr:MAG: hypothetical protein CM15mP122_5610 [Bacteroidota bacterium]
MLFRCLYKCCSRSRGADRIMGAFNPLGMAWGTDANAFSQMAEDYFNDSNAGGQLL